MKKLILLLFVPLVFACGDSDKPDTKNDSVKSDARKVANLSEEGSKLNRAKNLIKRNLVMNEALEIVENYLQSEEKWGEFRKELKKQGNSQFDVNYQSMKGVLKTAKAIYDSSNPSFQIN